MLKFSSLANYVILSTAKDPASYKIFRSIQMTVYSH
jgi:hypothetical protein